MEDETGERDLENLSFVATDFFNYLLHHLKRK